MRTITLLVAAALLVPACGNSDIADAVEDVSPATDAEEVRHLADQLAAAAGDQELSTVHSALELVGFTELAELDQFTFFAPNDSAFSQLDADELAAVLADPEALRALLRDHVVGTAISADELEPGVVTSVGGLPLQVVVAGETVTVNGVEIVRSDVLVEGGVVHVIDGVLERPE